jgi:hypothetical protein
MISKAAVSLSTAPSALTLGGTFRRRKRSTVDKPDSDLLAKVLDKARSQIGQSEKPPGSNGGGMVKQYPGGGTRRRFPWCAAFLYWCFREVEGEGTRCVKTAGVLDRWARAGQKGTRRIGFNRPEKTRL